jgi:hypothetical protein
LIPLDAEAGDGNPVSHRSTECREVLPHRPV